MSRKKKMKDGEVYDRLMADSDACPFCGGDDLDRDDIDGGCRHLMIEWSCGSCGGEWWEEYSLQKAGVRSMPDKSVTNPAAHARDMNDALEKADAKARPWFTLAKFQGDDDGQPE